MHEIGRGERERRGGETERWVWRGEKKNNPPLIFKGKGMESVNLCVCATKCVRG